MSSSLPTEAKVVIVGGGIIGSSVAYHLAALGWKDIVLLEQNELAGGTTWHAAGLVGRLRTTSSMTRINKYSAELYASLEQAALGDPLTPAQIEPALHRDVVRSPSGGEGARRAGEGVSRVGWKQVGSLIVARSRDRMTQLKRTAAMSEWFGVQVEMISAKAALEKWPLLRIDDVLGAAWLPHDGKVIPKEVALALARGAEARGAKIVEHVQVLEVLREGGRATGVRLRPSQSSNLDPQSLIEIKAEYVVLTGGMWTRQLGLACGVTIPLYPVEHHYVVTEPLPGAFDELPVGRDPDLCIYFRGEGDAVVLGAFQSSSKVPPWRDGRVPDNFSFQLLEPDWEKFDEPLRSGKHRIPALEKARFAKFVNGPESFTPDNNFIMGEAPELKNLFVAAGFNSVGIASAGGAGRYLAEWMSEGQPTLDLWSVDIRRFSPWANNLPFLRERVTEVLGLHYQLAWPNREFETGRNVRKSPLHDRLAAHGACFGAKNGWERPNWFARDGLKPLAEYSFERQNWFACHAAEHRAARENVAIFDQTGFGKLLFKGRDALSILQTLCGNDVDVPVGRTVYTAMLNQRGGFESDLTVVRLAEDEFYLITGTAQPRRDFNWISRHVPEEARAELIDVTEAFSVIGVMGPKARTLLERVTDADLSNAAFPFGTGREIAIGQATVRAIRITYVGELGWELHVPASQATAVYDRLSGEGRELGLTDAGHYAINSLRLEKGYRAWGAEISPDDTPLEAGLAFALAWQKQVAFIGRDALLQQKTKAVARQLVIFVLQDPEPVLWGSEPIYRDGKPVGYTTSGSYGPTLGAAVGMGYVNHVEGVNAEFIKTGRYEINVNGRRHPATAYLRPPYDPDRKRILV